MRSVAPELFTRRSRPAATSSCFARIVPTSRTAYSCAISFTSVTASTIMLWLMLSVSQQHLISVPPDIRD